jgi:hypothetical protein
MYGAATKAAAGSRVYSSQNAKFDHFELNVVPIVHYISGISSTSIKVALALILQIFADEMGTSGGGNGVPPPVAWDRGSADGEE